MTDRKVLLDIFFKAEELVATLRKRLFPERRYLLIKVTCAPDEAEDTVYEVLRAIRKAAEAKEFTHKFEVSVNEE